MQYFDALRKYLGSIKDVTLRRAVYSLAISLFVTLVLLISEQILPEKLAVPFQLFIIISIVLFIGERSLQVHHLLKRSLTIQKALQTRSARVANVIDQNIKALAENNEELGRSRDPSCSWESAGPFFKNLERHLQELSKEKPTDLYIYRRYDYCTSEANRDFRGEIVSAMQRKAIHAFYRVMVVTTDKSIEKSVDWIAPFAITPDLDPRHCHFCVTFRLGYNLGSFVVFGADKCFIAMPSKSSTKETGVVSETACGVFAERFEIAEVVRDYVTSLTKLDAHPNIHTMPFALEDFTDGKTFNSAGLDREIRGRFEKFSAAASLK